MPTPPHLVAEAESHSRRGDADAAIDSLRLASAATPRDAETWWRIGHLYAEHWRHADAALAFENALAHAPGNAMLLASLGAAKQELGEDEAALAALERAQAADPGDPRIALAARLFLPQVYDSVEDVAVWRERYARGLAAIEADGARFRERAAEAFDLERGSFLLAYQGEDDRELQARHARIVAGWLRGAAPQLRFDGTPTFDGSRALRVGFVASIFRDCTAGRYFERWITGLDARRFDARVYHTGPISDALTRRIEAASRFSHLRVPAREVAARLLADELDLIVYPEVGMDAMTYVLSALRLAPVQCAAWGHPVTTGSEPIDYFLTCGAMEPADASSQYTEKLVRLPGMGVDYAMPELPDMPSRASLRLPGDKRIYACAQSLFKVHPEMDSLFAQILHRDADAVLVFFQAPAQAVTRRFAARLERALAARGIAPRGQLKFLPRVGSRAFRGVLAACDVVLDTTRWSGGNTSLDAFAAGVPVVTMAGRFMRGRQTAAMLQAMGLETLVCADRTTYLETALRAAGDARCNAQLRGAIAEGRSALFGQRVQPAFEEALLAMAKRAA